MPYTAAYTRKELIANIKAINKIEGPLSIGQSLSIPVAWKEPLKARTVTRPRDFPAKGLYMNPSSAGTRFIFDSAERLKNLGCNTIVFDAKDDLGAITYPSPIRRAYCPEEKYYPNIEELPKLVEFLHRMGIHVAAGWWCSTIPSCRGTGPSGASTGRRTGSTLRTRMSRNTS